MQETNETLQAEQIYEHWSKNKAFIGSYVEPAKRPNELPLHPKRFKQSIQDKLDIATAKKQWKDLQKKRAEGNKNI